MRGANPATTAGHEHPFWVRMPTEESVDHEVENDPSLLSPVRSALHHGLGQLHAYSRFSADEGSHGADAIPGRAHGHSFSVPAGLLIPFAGVLSDHVGRKPVMAPALIIYGLGGLLAGLAAVTLSKPYAMILVARVVQGIGAGGTYQLAMALTSDIFTSDERTKALGYLEAANGLGKVLSPILGAAIGLISWYAPFFAYGLLALPIACLVWFLVDEPEDKKPQRQPLSQYIESLRRIFGEKASTLLAAYAAGSIGLFLLFGLLAFLRPTGRKIPHIRLCQRGRLGDSRRCHVSGVILWRTVPGVSSKIAQTGGHRRTDSYRGRSDSFAAW